MTDELEVVGRLVVAALLGLVLGLERERNGHQAGTRTFAVLCLGSATFAAVSTTGFSGMGRAVDGSRIASQVVVGVGFLGAGLIFRQGLSVQNLTTAAALWATAAVGVAAGVGQLWMAAVATLLVGALLLLGPGPIVARLAAARGARHSLRCRLAPERSAEVVRSALREAPEIRVEDWSLGKEEGRAVVEVALTAGDLDGLQQLVERLVDHPDVESVHLRR